MNRVVASHKMNHASSWSHSIFTLKFEAFDPKSENILTSQLRLVDLAGSEKVGLSGTTGVAYEESVNIN